MLVLGIESSCDETAAAVVRDGRELISSIISSQIKTHERFGGVVPELASREHLVKIVPVVEEAFARAGVSKNDVDGVAVTSGPGLIGSLLVGLSFAKGMAYALGRPLVGVNHIEGHIYSVVFENPPVQYPALALVVSGGHTNLFLVEEPGVYRTLARTRDDAAGEAFDKVSKMLGLGYPGGPQIERLAADGNERAVHFKIPQMSDRSLDFSFSGLKTAVTKHLRENGLSVFNSDGEPTRAAKDLAASFQSVVVRSLITTTERFAVEHNPRTLIVAGGVACNKSLRQAASEAAMRLGIDVYFPSPHLSTDNAAMIAAAGTAKLKAGAYSALDLNANATLRLSDVDAETVKLRQGKARHRL
ncbi:MAG: tRNA (adenosine(37)-N6)-threonylcarbamoyltransferase complex transferase subunit TsaD [Pyrinomonadaceae bacterium]|nr:tRNA (adenosine(37)-N6)-threonylcarbamoyltransferase complex transferase subunit TsaD [Pyrinomonadaceae bacterium]